MREGINRRNKVIGQGIEIHRGERDRVGSISGLVDVGIDDVPSQCGGVRLRRTDQVLQKGVIPPVSGFQFFGCDHHLGVVGELIADFRHSHEAGVES